MTIKVYVQGCDSYVGKRIVDAINARKKFWLDPPEEEEDEDTEEGIESTPRQQVELMQPSHDGEQQSDMLQTADIIVLNAIADVDEANKLLKEVRKFQFLRNTTLVCLSNVFTWNETAFDEESGLEESKFKSRKCSTRFKQQRLIETLTLNSSRSKLHTFVVASGLLYGQGEDVLHSQFKTAWHAESSPLKYIGEGDNVIPMIHVDDFSNILIRCLEKRPKNRYIVAIDDSKSTQRSIIEALGHSLGNGLSETVAVDDERVLLGEFGDANILQSNLIFNEDRFSKEIPNFEWKCESGFFDNVNVIVEEYLQCRDLRPIRAFVTGPPGAGKTFYSKLFAAKYFLPHIQVSEVIAKVKAKEDEFSEEVEKATGKNGRISDAILAQMVKRELDSPLLRNKGFILDGYPRTLADAKSLFEVDESAEEEVQEEEEDEKPRPPKRPVSLTPDLVVKLSCTEEDVAKRMETLDGKDLISGHNDEDGLKRRWKSYLGVNSSENESSPLLFFDDVEVLDIDINAEDIQESIQMYLDGGSKPFNYHPTTAELEEERKAEERQQRELALREELQRNEQLKLRNLEIEARAHEAAETHKHLEDLAQQEKEILNSDSLPLKAYLMDTVMGPIAEGLFEISKVQPEDPVDYLAEFLFRRSVQ